MYMYCTCTVHVGGSEQIMTLQVCECQHVTWKITPVSIPVQSLRKSTRAGTSIVCMCVCNSMRNRLTKCTATCTLDWEWVSYYVLHYWNGRQREKTRSMEHAGLEATQYHYWWSTALHETKLSDLASSQHWSLAVSARGSPLPVPILGVIRAGGEFTDGSETILYRQRQTLRLNN